MSSSLDHGFKYRLILIYSGMCRLARESHQVTITFLHLLLLEITDCKFQGGAPGYMTISARIFVQIYRLRTSQ